FVLFFTFRNLLRRIGHLKALASKMGSGDFSQRMVVEKKDEIDDLCEAFNNMGDELANFHGKLLENKEYSESIFRSMMDMLIVITPDRTVEKVNEATLSILGYNRNEMIGKEIAEFIDKFTCSMIGMEASTWKESYLIKKDGSRMSAFLSLSSIVDKKGGIPRFICVGRDMTEHILHEAEKTEMESQLIQADKLAALGELTASISHEMSQPLNGIKIVAQSTLRDIDKNRWNEGEIKRSLTEIVSLSKKMGEILDYTRTISRKNVVDEQTRINANTTISDMFRFYEKQMEAKKIAFVKEMSSALSCVMMRPTRLEQVLMNLISNAQHALVSLNKENKRIVLKTYDLAENDSPLKKDTVVIEVSDNGIGVPSHLESKIFESFFTTKGASGGTGLGLSISRKIIREVSGDILLENAVGQGACFKILLPAVR
ncbi:MAG: PAS domain S-box protein, partial [Oligoflexales bacterium]|nr:PAS domain S-box protein [Oligoflexales bacterium]